SKVEGEGRVGRDLRRHGRRSRDAVLTPGNTAIDMDADEDRRCEQRKDDEPDHAAGDPFVPALSGAPPPEVVERVLRLAASLHLLPYERSKVSHRPPPGDAAF